MCIVRAGRMEDIDQIETLIKICVVHMRAGGNDQWDEAYPNIQIAKDDIEKGQLFVCQDREKVVGIVTLNSHQEPEYLSIKWRVKIEKPLVVHRLAVHPEAQGTGVGKKIMNFAEEMAVKSGVNTVRLDTYSRNKGAVKFYEILGYKVLGYIHFARREPHFICFDKVLEKEC